MKEVLYKKEFRRYGTSKYKNYNHIEGEVVDIFGDISKRKEMFKYDSFDETKECFLENYGNPFCDITESIALIVVEKYDDKISTKIFSTYRNRRVGKSWFKVTKNMSYVTVNTKTGDVYYGGIDNYNLKRKCRKRIRRNYFSTNTIYGMMHQIDSMSKYVIKENITEEVFSIFTSQFSKTNDLENLSFDDRLFKFYLDKRNVKIPNNFYIFKTSWVGKEIKKILKKNDNRMIDTIMEYYKFSGKKIKSALHICENFNFHLYLQAKELFGDDWLNQDNQLILACLNSNQNVYDVPKDFLRQISKEELKRFFKLFKSMVVNNTINSQTLYDHIKFYCQLKRLGEIDLKWLSNNDDLFLKEHLEWTQKLDHYRNGTYERIYPEYSYDIIEQPIIDGSDVYYPKLLNDSVNYNEESIKQSNCVKTYITRPASIIVSLRKQNIESNERATIEYRVNKYFDDIKINRGQSLGRFNNRLSEEWNEVLFKLDKIMLSYIQDERFETVQIKKKCDNGVLIETETQWDELGNLILNNSDI